MKKSRLGCLTGSGLLAAFCTLLIITGIGLARGGSMFSPGTLNAQAGDQALGGAFSHADIEGRCAACHAPFWASDSMTDRCLSCHQDVAQIDKDFHTVMVAQGQELNCRRCHLDHRGPQASLIDFDLQGFPHDGVGFSLQAHQEMSDGSPFTCSDCHGERVNTFNVGACRTCHVELDPAYLQVHQEDFGVDCLACHDGIDTYGAGFDHNLASFPLEGGHASLACSACHIWAHSPADLKSAPQECQACHAQDDPHNGELGIACGACHNPIAWDQASFDHSQTAFPLSGGHQGVACQDCHLDNLFAGTPQDCIACHVKDDVHEGKFGDDCRACHAPAGWEQVDFDHSLAAFPLTGSHVGVKCEACHINGTFAGTSQECAGCHAQDDTHQGRFGEDCGACHTTDDWEGADFDHSLAAFPLTGAHVNVVCTDCHEGGTFAGTPQQCVACHADSAYHQGLFTAACDSCHTTAAWYPASFNLAHSFPINHGASGGSDCQVCHPSSLNAYTCYGCHEHNQANVEAKHREEGISNFQNCVRCHATGREEEGEREREDD
jgi:hypothetical protein